MLVHRKKRPRYQIQMPLTSLIDIVFLLLIYFLLTTNFLVEEGINIALPQAQAGAPQVKEEITVFVDKEGRAYVGDREIPIDQLYTRLKEMIGGQRDRLVVVKADRSIVLNKAVKVMDLAKAAGAERLCLATEKGL
ncbi:MAG: biopolymer transporter ExbD [Syntrophobacteraceae bacterium CG2_30_61_12]|nr:MAG: biopolymer transporter ExbD [Syntrophobacteraceae bacterium CG2_30_61_12]